MPQQKASAPRQSCESGPSRTGQPSRTRWLSLAAAVLSVAVAAEPAAAQALVGRRAPDAVTVVDASGHTVGAVVGLGHVLGGALVTLRVGDDVTLVTVIGDRIGAGSNQLGYATDDCSGAPLLVVTDPPDSFASNLFGPLRLSALGPGNVLHGMAGPSATGTVRSVWDGSIGCIDSTDVEKVVVPTTPLLDLGVFTLPLTLR